MGTATAVQAKPVPRSRAADSSLRLNESAIRGGTTGVGQRSEQSRKGEMSEATVHSNKWAAVFGCFCQRAKIAKLYSSRTWYEK